MNISNTVRLLTVMFMLVSGFESRAFESSADALQHPESLLSMIVSPERNKVNEGLRPECVNAVRKHVQSGGGLESNVVKKFSMAVKDFPDKDLSDLDVYHYTKPKSAEALTRIMQQQSYQEFSEYLRHNNSRMKDWFFYVAGDSKSSAWYGTKAFRFTLKPETQIYFYQGDLPGAPKVSLYDLMKSVTKDFVSINPELAACDYTDGVNSEFHVLTYLAAESSNVGAILYWGIGNYHGSFGGAQWLQIIDPSAFDSMEIFK